MAALASLADIASACALLLLLFLYLVGSELERRRRGQVYLASSSLPEVRNRKLAEVLKVAA